jgi:hypothetical protein
MRRDGKNMDEILKQHLPRASEEVVKQGSARVLGRLRKALQQREEEFGSVKNAAIKLRPFDDLVMTATQLLGGEGPLRVIWAKTQEISLKPVRLRSVYAALVDLEMRGLVTLRWDPPEPQEGVRRKPYFRLTANGRFALSQTKAAAGEVTDALGDAI